jgi:uncharacterized protein YndB with AHSA1/START domain
MLGGTRETSTRGPHHGRRGRAEPLANPTRPDLEWVMEHMRGEIRIEAPVEHVWAFVCDTSHWQDWMPRGEFSDFSGPYEQVGTTYAWKMKMMGFEMKGTSKVLEVEPLKLIREHTDDGPQGNIFRFERDGDATRLIIEADYEMPKHIPGPLKSLMTKAFFERQAQHMLGDLKSLAEATAPVPA